jgi:hypothetical protein
VATAAVDKTAAIAKKIMDLLMKHLQRNHAPIGLEPPLRTAEVYLEKIWSVRRWTPVRLESCAMGLSGFRFAG